MTWTRYFNKIILINLAKDKERLQRSLEAFKEYGIHVTVIEGIEHENGEEGIRQTLIKVFKHYRHLKRILIFEDDVKFVINPNLIMDSCVSQLRKMEWHLFYMGPNTHEPFKEFSSPNLLPVQHAYGLHATAYSRSAMNVILSMNVTNPIDVCFAAHIQTLGKSYCAYPFLVTQHPGYSNIQKKHMEQDYIEKKYYQNIHHLI